MTLLVSQIRLGALSLVMLSSSVVTEPYKPAVQYRRNPQYAHPYLPIPCHIRLTGIWHSASTKNCWFPVKSLCNPLRILRGTTVHHRLLSTLSFFSPLERWV
ncbi:hypothetical protein PF010_g20704 [Phytophthora fragariae]|uniref:RxLR effector protein n=1 Tax=Phytophthora fragariae TaxID=53985 RepID=A0A6A3TZQ7_9STRA|nr:hypothetical protein PF003_g2041 [Phytophthora fragariae]KAE9084777.1 hypothetical protein PF010_g20704 [Phytophthora fragariae]KAE9143858.1 hypothetical protein PF006_g11158 [Phytophthora fragariae]KAE9196202.1 hypothetical protein PF004_g20212 [Phytophthora fragariae]KAE9288544.1 hypothetical protein PF001_g20472 [Phytophthora fragariae]